MLAGDYSVADAAATCGIPARTVRYMCSKGEWQEYSYRQRVGKREEWRIQKAAVDAWREKHNTIDAPFEEEKTSALIPAELSNALLHAYSEMAKQQQAAAAESLAMKTALEGVQDEIKALKTVVKNQFRRPWWRRLFNLPIIP